jgi:CO dehydrogenase maturation factor
LRGLVAAEAMHALSHELEINVRQTHLVINRVTGDLPTAWRERIARLNVPLLAQIPYDPQLVEFDSNGRPLVELPDDAPVSQAVAQIARQLLNHHKESQ